VISESAQIGCVPWLQILKTLPYADRASGLTPLPAGGLLLLFPERSIAIVPLTAVPDIGWAVFTATSYLVAAVCHYRIGQREMLLGSDDSPPEVDT